MRSQTNNQDGTPHGLLVVVEGGPLFHYARQKEPNRSVAQ